MLRRLIDDPDARVVSASEMKAFDAHTIEVIGVSSLVLMERAALSVVDALTTSDFGFDLTRVVVACGVGNNGGDGLAIARLLHLHGVDCVAVIIGDASRMTPDCAQQKRICAAYGVPIAGLDVLSDLAANATTLVDALLGIGGDRELRGDLADGVAAISTSKARVLSVDVPTGISDDAQVLGSAVRADVTVSLAYPKRGLLGDPGREFAGDILVADIGIYAPAGESVVPGDPFVARARFVTGSGSAAVIDAKQFRADQDAFLDGELSDPYSR
ncbi:MAG: NAD(P)H-hydrate epimerase [Propionibacteriaceae bacterium]|jgi:NAD(P)H-hydrate epimerase|nr:NAD(P)H-hydrate epimerase [Propionibacteriaceae bacterium]